MSKTKLKNYLKNDIKKLTKTVENKKNSSALEIYKTKADYIMANLYSIKAAQKELVVDNLKIELDEALSPAQNAKKYYEKYKKEKSAYNVSQERANEAYKKLEYYNTIIFNIENSSNFVELDEIEQELIELGFIKNIKKETKETKIAKINFEGYDIYIGKNNIQNDYLISKIAKNEDLWFHGLNFPSAHIVLKIPKGAPIPKKEVIEFCAKLTKENSKAKDSGKTSIIMTKRQNLKKPPNTYPGYVTYKNETEIVIE